jgi:hypothetical protein
MLASDRGVTLERACRAQEGVRHASRIYIYIGSEKRDIYNISCMLFPRSSNPMTTALLICIDLYVRFGIFRLPLRTLSDSAHSLSVGTEGVAYLRSRDGWFGAKMIVTCTQSPACQ